VIKKREGDKDRGEIMIWKREGKGRKEEKE